MGDTRVARRQGCGWKAGQYTGSASGAPVIARQKAKGDGWGQVAMQSVCPQPPSQAGGDRTAILSELPGPYWG